MFDWNDEELANIIWGEDCKSDDHIVPYSEGSEEKPQVLFGDYNKKEWKYETAIKTELQAPRAQNDIYTHCDTNGLSASEFGMGLWPDLSLWNAAQTNYDSTAEIVQQDKDTEVFQDRVEDKDGSYFLDYGWANIESFDDLDRFVSHDDPVFGHVSLGNADELWSPPKDVTNSPVKLFPFSEGSPIMGPASLKTSPENFEIKTEFVQHDELSFTSGHGNLHEATSKGQLNIQELADPVECGGGKDKPVVKEQMALDMVGKTTSSDFIHTAENVAFPNDFEDKVSRQKKPPKRRKKAEGSDEKLLPALCGAWSPSGDQFQQLENHFTPPTIQSCLPSVLNQQRQLEEPKSLQYQHMSNSFLAPAPENFRNQCSTIPVLPCIQFVENKHPATLSGYEVSNPLEESQDAAVKTLTMTPREKIEKLRKRQQMQAILAIKRQQEQFSHEISSTGHSITQKCPQDSQLQYVEGSTIKVEENLNTHPFLDPYSPEELDDSNTTSLAIEDCSTAERIFHRLQDIIAKLDVRIRLCLRESLFRLAQSAMLRHYTSDTSSTNTASRDGHKSVIKGEISSHTRYSRIPEVETKTNPIDRAVAHLLFHRPLDLPRKHPESPESPVSTKLPHNCSMQSIANLAMGCLPESSQNIQNFCPQGSKSLPPLAKPQQLDKFKNSPSVETSENASNNMFAGGSMEIKAFL